MILEKTICKIFERIIWIKQTVLQLSQNLLEMLEKYKKVPYVFFLKVNQIFLKGQYGSTRNVPDSRFSEIKHELLKEIYQESLRRQYGLDCIVFSRLMKIL